MQQDYLKAHNYFYFIFNDSKNDIRDPQISVISPQTKKWIEFGPQRFKNLS